MNMSSLPALIETMALPLSRLDLKGRTEGLAASPMIACVPARDEAGHIERCLDALDRELTPSDGVVVVANGCRDTTVVLAGRQMSDWTRPWLLIDCDWHPGMGSAPLARRLAMQTAHGAAPNAALLSIDGDTLVLPGLRAAYATEFAAGFDLVCGRIGFLAEETAHLPPADPESEAVIREYRETSRRLAAMVLPDPDNPWPHHGNIGGANFAIRGAAYATVGGLPTPASAEDRALRRLCEGQALRIRYSNGPCVDTSCRLDGRASGGLADELRRNRSESDPVVDQLLEPPDRLMLRLRSRRTFLTASDAAERTALLHSLRLEAEAAALWGETGGPAAWQAVEDLSPALARSRLRLSDLHRHLPALRRALNATPQAPSDTRPFAASEAV